MFFFVFISWNKLIQIPILKIKWTFSLMFSFWMYSLHIWENWLAVCIFHRMIQLWQQRNHKPSTKDKHEQTIKKRKKKKCFWWVRSKRRLGYVRDQSWGGSLCSWEPLVDEWGFLCKISLISASSGIGGQRKDSNSISEVGFFFNSTFSMFKENISAVKNTSLWRCF